MRTQPLSADEEAEILAMVDAGKRYDEIVDWIGCSHGQVKRVANNRGEGRKAQMIERNLGVMAALKAGMPRQEIRRTFGISRDAISGVIKRAKDSGTLPA